MDHVLLLKRKALFSHLPSFPPFCWASFASPQLSRAATRLIKQEALMRPDRSDSIRVSLTNSSQTSGRAPRTPFSFWSAPSARMHLCLVLGPSITVADTASPAFHSPNNRFPCVQQDADQASKRVTAHRWRIYNPRCHHTFRYTRGAFVGEVSQQQHFSTFPRMHGQPNKAEYDLRERGGLFKIENFTGVSDRVWIISKNESQLHWSSTITGDWMRRTGAALEWPSLSTKPSPFTERSSALKSSPSSISELHNALISYMVMS